MTPKYLERKNGVPMLNSLLWDLQKDIATDNRRGGKLLLEIAKTTKHELEQS